MDITIISMMHILYSVIIADFSLNKSFYDLIFEVMHYNISIKMLTIILPHVSIAV